MSNIPEWIEGFHFTVTNYQPGLFDCRDCAAGSIHYLSETKTGEGS